MKKLNYYLWLALVGVVVSFSSCEKEVIKEVEKEVLVEREIQRISFEYVELNESGYQNNFPDGLILSDVNFYNYKDEFSWEGFAVSRLTDKTTQGWENQYSVYGDKGADNSEKFAVAFAGFNETTNLKFLSGQEFLFKELKINNSAYAALTVKNGDAFAKKFESGDWFKIVITGLKANGDETGKIEFYLADFRNGKSYICQDWTKIDLTSLGKVNKLEFAFDSTDTGEWGINTPQYACIDNIIYYVE